MKRIWWSFLICGVCVSCNQDKSQEENPAGHSAVTGSIKGVVSYKDNEKTLPDVGTTVYAVSTTKPNSTKTPGDKFGKMSFQATVDANGNFALDNLPADTYTVIFKSNNAPKKLTYYETRFSPVLEPLVNDMPVNNLNGESAKKSRLKDFFKEKQVQVKPEVKLEGASTQILTQEFIKQ